MYSLVEWYGTIAMKFLSYLSKIKIKIKTKIKILKNKMWYILNMQAIFLFCNTTYNKGPMSGNKIMKEQHLLFGCCCKRYCRKKNFTYTKVDRPIVDLFSLQTFIKWLHLKHVFIFKWSFLNKWGFNHN